jgi:hypothetical protein
MNKKISISRSKMIGIILKFFHHPKQNDWMKFIFFSIYRSKMIGIILKFFHHPKQKDWTKYKIFPSPEAK